MRSSLGLPTPVGHKRCGARAQTGRGQEAMAQWQRVGFQTQRLGVRIPLASHPFFGPFFLQSTIKKNALPKLGIAPRLPRPQRGVLLLDYFGATAYGGSGYRSRFSTLRRLYATMYNNPPCASIGTRTHNLTLRRGAPCPLGHGGLVPSRNIRSEQIQTVHSGTSQRKCLPGPWAVGLVV